MARSVVGAQVNFLSRIVELKRNETEAARQTRPLAELREAVHDAPPARSLTKKLKDDNGFHLVCEIKRASPSRGIINGGVDPVRQVVSYQESGASAVSVLTEKNFFRGALSDLTGVRSRVNIPVLRKDFIIDAYQIYESRAAGADLILLIAKILERRQVEDFIALAAELRLEVLLEVCDETDLSKIPSGNGFILGVNNRNLETFEVDIAASLRLKPLLPGNIPAITESGMKSGADCRKMQQAGFVGALVGEALMRSEHPGELIRVLKGK